MNVTIHNTAKQCKYRKMKNSKDFKWTLYVVQVLYYGQDICELRRKIKHIYKICFKIFAHENTKIKQNKC